MTVQSDEHTRAYIAALERERRSPTADHAAIDAELARVTDARSPRERAERRPRTKPQTRT
jgi:hypothetical protein